MSGDDQQQDSSKTELPDEIALARQYFASDFPNPEREGCPAPAEIEQSISSGNLPDESLRKHLLACSACFTRYREILDAHRSKARAATPFWQRLFEFAFERRLVLAFGLVILLMLAGPGLYLLRKSPQNSSTTSVTRSPEAVNANVSPTVTPSPAPAAAQNESVPEPVNLARVDLRANTLRRGSKSNEAKPLEVQQAPTLFSIKLPEGSPAGAYSVSLLNAFGKAVRTRSAQSPDGKKLTTTLNLNNLENQKYRLCVSRVDEPPNCYPVQITNKGRKDQ